MQQTIPERWLHPFLIALLPCVINAFPFFSSSACLFDDFPSFISKSFVSEGSERLLFLRRLRVIGFKKWHLAFRSDRLRAICSVFAEGGTVNVLRTDEETGNGAWNAADSRNPSPHKPIWINERSHLYITESVKEESSQGKQGRVLKIHTWEWGLAGVCSRSGGGRFVVCERSWK